MAKVYKEKVANGEVSYHSSGFGGHGVEKFDAQRAAERAREKKIYKTGDEPDDEEEVKEKKGKESEVEKLLAKAAGAVKGTDTVTTEEPAAPEGVAIRSDLAAHLDRAMKVEKVELPPASASQISDPLAKAAAAAASISNRLGTKGTHHSANNRSQSTDYSTGTRPGAPPENRGPDAGAFHATLEINDFPQKARWAVTNRTNVARILEATGTSITTKGSYKDPTKPVPEGEFKLFILVEGDTEIAVSSAMKMLTEKLREGMMIAQESEARGGAGGGRYRVV
jgi:ATP-dependent RNA helicase DDX46/PRP5